MVRGSIFALALSATLGCQADTGGFSITIERYPETVEADEAAQPLEIVVTRGYEDHLPYRLWFPHYPVVVEFRADPDCVDDPSWFDCGVAGPDGVVASRMIDETEVHAGIITTDFLPCHAPDAPAGASFEVRVRVVVVDKDGLESNTTDTPFTCITP